MQWLLIICCAFFVIYSSADKEVCEVWSNWSSCLGRSCVQGKRNRTQVCHTKQTESFNTEIKSCTVPCSKTTTTSNTLPTKAHVTKSPIEHCSQWTKWSTCHGEPCKSGKTKRTKYCSINKHHIIKREFKKCNVLCYKNTMKTTTENPTIPTKSHTTKMSEETCSDWTKWSSCSVSLPCKSGQVKRSKYCRKGIKTRVQNEFKKCDTPCETTGASTTPIGDEKCGQWSEWGSCTRFNTDNCDNDKRSRTRICQVDEGKRKEYQYKPCQLGCTTLSPSTSEPEATTTSTGDDNCSQWSEWGSCTRFNTDDCDNDKRSRTRICQVDEGKRKEYQYKSCQLGCTTLSPSTSEPEATTTSTGDDNCSQWSEWGSCTRFNTDDCDNDKRSRTRICQVDEGKRKEYQYKSCQLDCTTLSPSTTESVEHCSEWSGWSECKGEKCTIGKTIRRKYCKRNNKVKILKEVAQCVTPCTKTTTNQPTTPDIFFNCGKWSTWGTCTRKAKETCNLGSRNRTRICDVTDKERKKEIYQFKSCKLDCTSTTASPPTTLEPVEICENWSKWSKCFGSACKSGVKQRSRNCKRGGVNVRRYENKACEVPCSTTEALTTPYERKCTEWTGWSPCMSTTTCQDGKKKKKGQKTRNRVCFYMQEVMHDYQHKECVMECPSSTTYPTHSPTITADPFVDHVNCSRCDTSHGQGWLPDPQNCHGYYVCVPIYNTKKYRIFKRNCGVTYWNQKLSTCTTNPDPSSKCDMHGKPIPATTPIAPVTYACSLTVYPADHHYFWSGNDRTNTTLQKCAPGTIFSQQMCTCIMDNKGTSIPCISDPMLYFPFDDHFNDVSCTRASTTVYGDLTGAQLKSEGQNKFVCFGGKTHFEVAFIRRWFANKHMQNFTISVWFKYDKENTKTGHAGILHNGDCKEDPGFEVGTQHDTVYTGISTEIESRIESKKIKINREWHHVVWKYNGKFLAMYNDGILTDKVKMNGDMSNTDAPLVIGKLCKHCYFKGCIDNLKIFSRGLTNKEIYNEFKQRNS